MDTSRQKRYSLTIRLQPTEASLKSQLIGGKGTAISSRQFCERLFESLG